MSLLALGLGAIEDCTSALVTSSQSELGRICAQESLRETALKVAKELVSHQFPLKMDTSYSPHVCV